MRRYELMLVLRPDLPTTRARPWYRPDHPPADGAGGQIVKVRPWGRRRLAYPIDRHREGSYHIILFEAPPESIVELERGLHITEEVLRHLVTRVERPVKASRARTRPTTSARTTIALPPGEDEEYDEPQGELIDESESEAAPAAID